MTGLTIIPTITSLPVDVIEIGDRLRPTTEPTLAALEIVIAEFGFTVPILVRKVKSGFRLIDGAHRLTVVKRRGDETIPVVALSCTDEEARVLEGSQNLAGAAMSPLDESIFLAAFGEAYQALHPETRRGAAGALAKHGLATELSSFAEVIGEKRSITPRQVRKIAAAGRLISKQDADQLRGLKRKLTLKDIQDFGKISDTGERTMVVLTLSGGNAKSVSAARKQLKAHAEGTEAPEKDPVEEAFKALSNVWSRTQKVARRRFVAEHAAELAALLNGEADDE